MSGSAGGSIDTLLVPGTWSGPEAIEQDDLARAAAATTGRAGRVAGVCAGAFLLGAVGLLDGRRATTHWIFLDALALVESDHGAALARGVGRHLVVFMQRPGGQAQFSVRLDAPLPPRSPLRPLLDAIAADPAADHRLPALGARAGFSERHLVRVFARELGTTPARYVASVRVEAARMMLEASDMPLATVARASGRPRPCGAPSSAPSA